MDRLINNSSDSQDATERVAADPSKQIAQLQRELEISRAQFRAIINKTVDGVILLSPEGVIRFVNPAAEELLGRSLDGLKGEVFGVPAVPGETIEIEILRPDGPPRIAEMRIVETEWHGEPAHLAALRDITEHKRNEEEAQEAVRRRDRFLAMLSHELRNPLAAVVSAAHLIRRCPNDRELLDQANEVIERQCAQMARLLDDLLEVSRMLKGKIDLRRECLNLVNVVEEAVAAMIPLVEQHQHRLTKDVSRVPILLEADPARLHQILVNLLTNAIKYSPRGSDLHVSLSRDGDHSAVIRVRDSGVGVAAESLESIFEPFVQLDHTLARSDVGLGIGLTLVKQLVELHQGEVTAYSDGPNQGSEFVVRLPIEDEAPDEALPTERELDKSALRIAVVEDNSDSSSMLRSLLELDGHTVLLAEDGQAGYELIELQRPDVALIDVGLPKLDGYEVARQLRASRANDGVYLVALTGYGQPQDRRQALHAGFDAHLVKPISINLLYRLLTERHASQPDDESVPAEDEA